MYHKLILVGNLGKDPEMRFTGSGANVTHFSVATSENWTGADGQKQERTIWWNISVFGKAGEACNDYLKKGNKVLIEGRMNADAKGNPRLYDRSDGSKGASFEVTALTVKFLTPKGAGSNGAGDGQLESEPADEAEIPF